MLSTSTNISKMKILLRFFFLLFIALNVCSLKQISFRKMNLNCIFESTTLFNFSGTSLIHCAFHCTQFWQRCNRFIWSSVDDMCTFSINDFVSGSTFNGLDGYSIVRKDCNKFGYDFDQESNTCLRYIRLAAGVMWDEARIRCQQDGGDLISITSKKKFDFVVHYKQCVQRAWIGLKAKTWLTGEPFQNIFGNDTRQLNDYDNKYPLYTGPFCGMLSKKIGDYSCDNRTMPNFLCEIVL